MKTFETSATVQQSGEIHLCGVPFAVGTEVEVSIKPAQMPDVSKAEAQRRAAQLFAVLDKARNTESVGPLRREQIYDRKILR